MAGMRLIKARERWMPDGCVLRDEVFCLIEGEDNDNYYGWCYSGGRVVGGVRFPKEKARELTDEERREFWFVSILGA